MEKFVGKLSKKLALVGGFMTWLIQAPLPDELKLKYGGGVTLGYVIIQGIIDSIKAWKGRKPTTDSNAFEKTPA